jgi:hypothetical protein
MRLSPRGRDELKSAEEIMKILDVQANLVAVALLGAFDESLRVEVGQPGRGQISEAALKHDDLGTAECRSVQQPSLRSSRAREAVRAVT